MDWAAWLAGWGAAYVALLWAGERNFMVLPVLLVAVMVVS